MHTHPRACPTIKQGSTSHATQARAHAGTPSQPPRIIRNYSHRTRGQTCRLCCVRACVRANCLTLTCDYLVFAAAASTITSQQSSAFVDHGCLICLPCRSGVHHDEDNRDDAPPTLRVGCRHHHTPLIERHRRSSSWAGRDCLARMI